MSDTTISILLFVVTVWGGVIGVAVLVTIWCALTEAPRVTRWNRERPE